MNYTRSFVLTGALVASAALAVAQDDAPPVPPAAPRAAAAPAPQSAPAPPAAPAAPTPMKQYLAPPVNEYYQMDREQARELAEQARQMAEEAREQVRGQAQQLSQEAREQARAMADQAREMARDASRNLNFNFDMDITPRMMPAMPPMQVKVGVNGQGLLKPGQIRNDGTLYGRGLSALDEHHYDQALDDFNEVVTRGGPKADGALYWKAYTLNKLGKRDDATAAIEQLRTAYASSHWLEDAKALEIEVKQASGKPVSPESEADDDLKLMALNGLSQSDPERTFPLIEKILKGPASPKLKKNAIFVLASNSSPRAQQLLEQIARGNSNPDLQMTAIRYMVQNKQQPNRSQVLVEIYGATSDLAVKREILNAFRSNRDYDRLLQIAKSEKTGELRQSAFAGLGDKTGNAELWQLFQVEPTSEGKVQILDSMYNNGSAEKLADVARTDKDPKVRMAAIRVLSSYKSPNGTETLTTLYSGEQDPQVKRMIIGQISSGRNAKALVDIFHKEQNIELKKDIVQRLQNMHTPEANELFLEILK